VSYRELHKRLYHGSAEAVSNVDLSKSAPKKDFGSGFYTTTDSGQAEKFAKLKANRERTGKGRVSVFDFRDIGGLKVKKFAASNEEWFDFVLSNRGYGNLAPSVSGDEYDIVIGPVANDAVGAVLNLFVSGAYGEPDTAVAKETAISLLLAQKLHNQIFFGTELAVSGLIFSEVYDVYLK
jgi:hypothetical protein